MKDMMEEMFNRIKEDTIRRLSEVYGFEYEEGVMLEINVEYMVKKEVDKKDKVVREKKVREKKVVDKKDKVVREKKDKVVREKKDKVIVLPFSGEIVEGVCNGLKVNHGLHTQCMMKCSDSSLEYCRQCEKQCGKNSSGKPNNGTIGDRVAGGDEYKDGRGRNPVAYVTVMRKLNITREEVEGEVLRLNLVFDVKHFEEVTNVKKNKSDDVETKRGRPKRIKTMDVVSTEGSPQDIFDVLISEVVESGSKSDEEEVEEEVEEFEFEGVVYLRTKDNNLYDKDTEELKGKFNEERQMIEECDDEEDSDEDAEEDRC